MRYRVGSMFAGIGGTCLGFMQAGAEIVWANELDKHACRTYRENFGGDHLQEGNITEVDKQQIPNLDILIAGFPCQAFSIAGYRKGFNDDRGNMFFQILDVITAQQEKPKAIFLENVKNLISHDDYNTYKVIKRSLEELGYTIKADILNSMHYGNVPQSRERIYIAAFLDPKHTERFAFPGEIPLTNELNQLIDRDLDVDRRFYYTERSRHYPVLKKAVVGKETIYQLRRIYVRENKNKVCPTLTANMGTGGHNVPIIMDDANRIRKLTPRECLRLQGFPEDFKIPHKLANGHVYKQAGNSVTVPVIANIAKNMLAVLNGEAISNGKPAVDLEEIEEKARELAERLKQRKAERLLELEQQQELRRLQELEQPTVRRRDPCVTTLT